MMEVAFLLLILWAKVPEVFYWK